MVLHVFNADNDMALAQDAPGYTPPLSIQRMMRQTALLPARWANRGDGILTDEGVWVVEEEAPKEAEWSEQIASGKGHYITVQEAIPLLTEVCPWGWSAALCHRLRRRGIPERFLPDAATLRTLRELSSRASAVKMLALLRPLDTRLAGEAFFCTTAEEVTAILAPYPRTILKAPWSGSGKGIRYGQGGREDTLAGWYNRILQQQGGVVVEPFYDKSRDFAMEFWSDGAGEVTYRGLSLFTTHHNGAYKGNLIAQEEVKRQMLVNSVLEETQQREGAKQNADEVERLLRCVQEALCQHLSQWVGTYYRGPLGVDMMVLRGGRIHPCVEINLRMTMGYAALLN